MTSVRAAKAKGSAFEYDCQHSLSKIHPEIYRTSERGFQLQYDLECDTAVFECKRLKSMSWNQAKKYFVKLVDKLPESKLELGKKFTPQKIPYLLFKSNQQPCLVMYFNPIENRIQVTEFESGFGVPFEKHPSTRKAFSKDKAKEFWKD